MSEWQPIETAPRDGTRIIGLDDRRYGGLWPIWWEATFAEWIESCREMVMAPGYTIDGQARKLHSPEIREPRWWIPMPTIPDGASSRPHADAGPVPGLTPNPPPKAPQ